ncbi:MAG: C45 family autoproteolytic acyltransferase/hydrolase [Thermogutta sp.]
MKLRSSKVVSAVIRARWVFCLLAICLGFGSPQASRWCHAEVTSPSESEKQIGQAIESRQTYQVVRVSPDGHGLLARHKGKTILVVSGSPQQMGKAHGLLLSNQIRYMVDRVLYGVGAFDSVQSGVWFIEQMEEIHRRTQPFIPDRYLAEIDALAEAAGVSQRDARYTNLFPERFHCSGVAVRGKASKDGRVIHARVLDYMRDINLQGCATVEVFMPADRYAWMSAGYSGLVGTVTAMNEKGLAVGEMGGRGEGNWDGMPMTLLLREIMERAGTVQEALEILKTTRRTCEYYYVFSDRTGDLAAVRAVPEEVLVLRPGEQHPLLPYVPEDTVFISADERAQVLSQRLQAFYGKIDVPVMMEIIKRPVAMSSNLHDAIMLPETLDMWVADAGRFTPACDEPYVKVNLREIVDLYREVIAARSN